VTTYGVREFKARLSEILSGLEEGDEVIITRHGKPCARLTAAPKPEDEKRSLRTLRGAFAGILPQAEYEDFLEAKKIWEPRMPPEFDDEASDGAG